MASQLLIQSGDNGRKLNIEQSVAEHIQNPKFSDVCFLVGDFQEKIYAHRFFLAAESEVFERMFHGQLKETGYEIKVPDLSPNSFGNMIK